MVEEAHDFLVRAAKTWPRKAEKLPVPTWGQELKRAKLPLPEGDREEPRLIRKFCIRKGSGMSNHEEATQPTELIHKAVGEGMIKRIKVVEKSGNNREDDINYWRSLLAPEPGLGYRTPQSFVSELAKFLRASGVWPGYCDSWPDIEAFSLENLSDAQSAVRQAMKEIHREYIEGNP
ncbi:MAG TPA: hypothetical protein VM425_21040 [Myxococcota bacterium]|nr:hypothetical protein [Myxococcota bacterium]